MTLDNPAIKGVVFDLFHTLTGRESEWSDLPFTSEVLRIDRRLWDDLLVSRSRWRLAGLERDPYTILSTLAREADPAIPDDRVREALRVRIERFKHALARIPPENIATLKTLRAAGYRLGLISNADVIEVAAWPDSSLAGLFEVEIFSCAVGCVKPERAIFQKCLDALTLPAEACMFVGDGGSNELVAAKNIGMSTVFVSGIVAELWPECIEERMAQSDYHIERIPQILPLLGVTSERADST